MILLVCGKGTANMVHLANFQGFKVIVVEPQPVEA